MRTTIESALLGMLLCSLLCGCGQSTMRASQDADAQAVWEVRLAVQEALRTENPDALMELFTEDATFYVPNVGTSTGKEQIREAHERLFETWDDIRFEFKRLAIRFPAPDVAIEDVSYVFTATGLESNGRDTTVLVKRNDRWLITAVLDLIPLAPAQSTAEQAKVDAKEDIDAIRKQQEEFPVAHEYHDGAKLAEFYTEDAMLIPPNEPIVKGKQAIAEWYERQFRKAQPIENPTVTIEEIEVFGNLAFNRGNFILKFEGETTDKPTILNLRFITIWQKQPDGSWKFYRDIWNTNAPPQGERQAS